MDCIATHLSYGDTGYFSSIVTDYLNRQPELQSFYEHSVSAEGLQESIAARKKFATNRQVLVDYLQQQYNSSVHGAVTSNIKLLAENNTFTVCTAHQPAIFTGTLYFIYKILHTIRLSRWLSSTFKEYKFVPVFYMGCEDADLDELGHIHLNGEKINWDTKQTGAVGRMKPAGLDKLINRIEGELSVEPHGKELVNLLKKHYSSHDIQTSTFNFLNDLFGEWGLIVLIPDAASLKKMMTAIFEDDLFRQIPSSIVQQTTEKLSAWKVQANPREINLFYLDDKIRERITRVGDHWTVVGTNLSFTEAALKKLLQDHPEKFSPNVILRGLFQETILPNIAFIGGGGELAYWLELKGLFHHYKVPYPVLVLRNSFLIIEKKWKEKLEQLALDERSIFQKEQAIINELVKRESALQLSLEDEISNANGYYAHLKQVATRVDRTLEQHVSALQAKAVKPLQVLEKKLLRAEKRKFETQKRQVEAIRDALFPNENLQERIENFMPFYAHYGREFLKLLYDHSLTLEQQFTVLTLK
jgi:bacillithiol biosynthesis cysteine-adding enzyme BshC